MPGQHKDFPILIAFGRCCSSVFPNLWSLGKSLATHFTSVCFLFKINILPSSDLKNNMKLHHIQFSSVQSLSHVQLFVTPWTAACQASLSSTNSWSLPKLMSIESMMPFISSSVVPFSFCLQFFPASGSFPMNPFFASSGQSIGV